jgi:hypothetical protein
MSGDSDGTYAHSTPEGIITEHELARYPSDRLAVRELLSTISQADVESDSGVRRAELDIRSVR